jgi:hypothetical protein
MSQSTSSRRVAICAVVLVISVFAVVGTGIGIMPANGAIWSVGDVSDISIGNNQSQTIDDIRTRSGDKPVKVHVGELVEKGASLNESNASYVITDRADVARSDVYIKNSDSHKATIVVDESIPDGSGFDLKIRNINTRNVSKYNNYTSKSALDVEYVVSQQLTDDKYTSNKDIRFSISSQSKIKFQENPYNSTTQKVQLKDLDLIRESNYVIIWETSSGSELAQQVGRSQGHQKQIEIESSSLSGETDLAATIHPGNQKPNTDVVYAADNQSIQFPVKIEADRTPVHYIGHSEGHENNSSRISIPFNTELDSDEGNLSIELVDHAPIAINLSENSSRYRVVENRLEVFLNTSYTDNQSEHPHVYRISVEGIESKKGESTYDQKEYTPHRVSQAVRNKTAVAVAQGSYIMLDKGESSEVALISESSEVLRGPIEQYGDILTVNTSKLTEGEYRIRSRSKINQSKITVTNDALDPQVQTTAVNKGIQVNFRASRKERDVSVDIYNDDSTVRTILTDGGSNISRNDLNISTPGEYDIEFTNLATGKGASEKLTVLKKQNLTADVVGSTRSHFSGEVVRVGVNSTYNTSDIELNKPRTNTTAATIELATPKRGATTLELNTYLAAAKSLNESVSVRGSNASIASITTPDRNGTLSPGRYELSVHSTQGLAKTSDNASLTLTRRATNRLTAYAGPEAAGSELKTAAAVRDAIESGTLSPAEQIGGRDTVVYAVNASGLTGLVRTQNTTLETGRDLERLGGLEFGVRSDGRNTSQSAGDVLGETPPNATVHADRTGLYVVTDGANAFPTDGAPTPGAEFTAAFRVADDRLQAAADPSSDHRVNETVTFATDKRSGSAGGEPERGDSNAPVDDGSGGTSGGGGGAGGGGGGAGGGGGGADGGGSGAGPTAGSTGETQGSTPAGSVGHGRPDDGTAENTPESGGNDGGNASEGEIRFAPLPMTAGWLPLEGGSRGVTASAATGPSGPTDSASPVNGAGSTDGDGADGVTEATSGRSGQTDPGEGASSRPTPTYENAPIRATAEDVPGFGPLHTVAALAVTVLTAVRRMRLR